MRHKFSFPQPKKTSLNKDYWGVKVGIRDNEVLVLFTNQNEVDNNQVLSVYPNATSNRVEIKLTKSHFF
jgi:hypothetical protein